MIGKIAQGIPAHGMDFSDVGCLEEEEKMKDLLQERLVVFASKPINSFWTK